jgi:Mce-associated membrane protein
VPAAPEQSTSPTLQWRPPTLERPAATSEPAGPQSSEPEPAEPGDAPQPGLVNPRPESGSPPAGDVEVSVRVAAEGMAAALAGSPLPHADAEPRSRSVGPLAVATAVCVVLAVAAAVLLAVTARSNSHHRAVAAARAAALDAAKRQTAVALTYDYRHLDADFQRAEAGMSRRFRANYAETAAKSVAPLAKKTHAVTSGTVAAGGVVSATPDRVRVLVFANQVIENNLLNATSRLDRSVIEVTMVKEDGRWVIDSLQPF